MNPQLELSNVYKQHHNFFCFIGTEVESSQPATSVGVHPVHPDGGPSSLCHTSGGKPGVGADAEPPLPECHDAGPSSLCHTSGGKPGVEPPKPGK